MVGRHRNVSVFNFNGSSLVDQANTVLTESNLQNSHRKNPEQIVLLNDRNFILVLLYQMMCLMEFQFLLLVFLFPVARVDIEIRINLIENMSPCFCIFKTCKTTMVLKKFVSEMTGYL